MRLGRSILPAFSSVFASVAVLLASASASAQSGAADELYKAGIQLIQKNQTAAACEKFQASYSLEPLPSTLTALATCREQEGKTATAYGHFKRVAENEKENPDRQKFAADRAKALEPKLIRMTIDMHDRPKGLTITLDGKEVADAVLGISIPMDPGEHIIIATAPGKKDWMQKLNLGPSQVANRIDIPALEDGPSGQISGGGGTNVVNNTRFVEREKIIEKDAGSTQRVFGYIGVATGGAALLAAGGFQIFALSEESASKDAAKKGETASAASHHTAAKNNQLGATVLAISGGVVGITGLVLLLTVPKAKTQSGMYVTPNFSPGYGGLVAGGRF
jgi:hypothetical protein